LKIDCVGKEARIEFVWILRVLDLTSPGFVFLHDSMQLTWPREIREDAKARIRQVMETAVELSVPLKVDFCD
jgi:DNA polymerase I-like protein with 3'-5' exonuclease and polymerase domains